MLFLMQSSEFRYVWWFISIWRKITLHQHSRKLTTFLTLCPVFFFFNRYEVTKCTIEKLRKFPIKWYILSNCTNFGPFFSWFYWTNDPQSVIAIRPHFVHQRNYWGFHLLVLLHIFSTLSIWYTYSTWYACQYLLRCQYLVFYWYTWRISSLFNAAVLN